MAQALPQPGEEESLVAWAVSIGDADRLRRMLAQGASSDVPDGRGEHPLGVACRLARSDCMAVLADHGALASRRAPSSSCLAMLCLQSDAHECLATILARGAPMSDAEAQLAMEMFSPTPGIKWMAPNCVMVMEAELLRRSLPPRPDKAPRPPRL